MTSEHINVFESELELPDAAGGVAKRLIGFETRYGRLKKHLQLLMDSDGLEAWSKKQYGKHVPLLDALSDRYPLVVFHGDVGTGKTATAEAVANAMARDLKKNATLFKLSTRVRGSGNVGEMIMLINQAFEVVMRTAGKTKSSFLIIDEGDSLAASRNNQQSHHEDKVGVNTLVQKIHDARRAQVGYSCFSARTVTAPSTLRHSPASWPYSRSFADPMIRERQDLFVMDCCTYRRHPCRNSFD